MKTNILILILLLAQSSFATDRAEVLKRINHKGTSLFLNKIWDSCEAIKDKVPVPISLAVALLESKAGKTKNSQILNNYFNVQNCGVFKAFDCELDSFIDFALELEKCHKNEQTIFDFLNLLERCKSRKHAKKVERIIKRLNLFLL